MTKSQFAVAVLVALLLGLLVSLLAAGGFTPARDAEMSLIARAGMGSEVEENPLSRESTPSPTSTPDPTTAPPDASGVRPAPAWAGPDIADVLLVQVAAQPTNFDVFFCNVAEFYGLGCATLDASTVEITAEMLVDEAGEPFKLIGLSASTLAELSALELNILRALVEQQGASLLVYEVDEETNLGALQALTDDAVIGVTDRNDSVRNWKVMTEAPEVTRELSGQSIELTRVLEQTDWSLELNPDARVTQLITSVDDFSQIYPIFVMQRLGQGAVFLNAGDRGEVALRDLPLRSLYYEAEHFSKIVPLMMTMRYTMGDEAWHQDVNYANLTLDGAPLAEGYQNLNYAELLRQMERHDFHTTIALIPAAAEQSQPDVISLFTGNPDRFSLVQNGNNKDGYEFYYYQEGPGVDTDQHAPRPLLDQELDIREGLERMLAHERNTGIAAARVMIFPYGISPAPTLRVLKELNYLGTVNAQDVPLGEVAPPDWDFGMHQAVLDYEGFPLVARRQYINSFQSADPFIRSAALDLFIDRPALFWSEPTPGQLFTRGMGEFNVIADRVNAIPGQLEWRSLGYILSHMHKMKVNDDQSVDIMMCCGQLEFRNNSGMERIYHLRKQETDGASTRRVLVNGVEFPYRFEDGFIIIDLHVPAHSDVQVLIEVGGD